MAAVSLTAHYRTIWHRRELIWQLALKNFKVRYKSPAVTLAWAVFKPLALMLIFAMLFHFIGGRVKVGLPYAVFFLSGFIVWSFFSGSVQEGAVSLLSNPDLIKKIYFPREILPCGVVLEQGFNFCIALALLLVFALAYGVVPDSRLVLFPVACLLLIALSLGCALIAAGLATMYRDVRHVIDLTMTLLFYATPVFYPVSMVPERLLPYYFLNPVAGVVTLMRAALLGWGELPPEALVTTSITSGALLVIGIILFQRHEARMADYL